MSDKNFGDPTTGSTVYVGLVGVLIFVLTVIYLEALFYNSQEQQRLEKVVAEPVQALIDTRDKQNADLAANRYDHLYNNNAGRVTIPIDEATEKLLSEWGQRQGTTTQ